MECAALYACAYLDKSPPVKRAITTGPTWFIRCVNGGNILQCNIPLRSPGLISGQWKRAAFITQNDCHFIFATE